MSRTEVIVKFSLGATILCLVCSTIVGIAILSHAMIEPEVARHPPRLCPPSLLKEALDEIKYGPVNRDKQEELKDGFLDRIRSRRQSRQTSYAQQPCQPVQQFALTQTATCCPQVYVESPASRSSTKVVEYPSTTQPAKNLPTPYSSACATCPKSESKTGAFICSHCRQPKVGEQWHTDWLADGSPLTYLCRQCNAALSVTQKQSVFQSYMRTQAASAVAGAIEPEVSR